MAFSDSTKSFFDELSTILEAQQAEKEEGIDQRNDRPFSSMLTQDEEPTEERSPNAMGDDEPEIITRGA